MGDDQQLFTGFGRHKIRGRRRRALEKELRRVRESDAQLSESGVASLYAMADQLDWFDAVGPAKPYDLVPYHGLQRQFDDTHDRTFAAVRRADNPLAAALAAIVAADVGTTATFGHSPEPPTD